MKDMLKMKIALMILIMLSIMVLIPKGESQGQINQTENKTQPEITYTPSSETTCINKTCTLTLYSGIRYVNESGNWVNVESAKSLKGKGFDVVYIEKDKDLILDVIDFNWTSITVSLQANNISKSSDIPIKVYSPNASKTITGDFKKDYDIKSSMVTTFSSSKDVKVQTMHFSLGDILEFGSNSTTITLNESNGGNVGDTFTLSTSPTYNYGVKSYNQIRAGKAYYAFILWNMSVIPDGVTIINANLTLTSEITGTSTEVLSVFNTTVFNTTGTTYWSEGNKNGAACGSGVDCNLDHNMTYNNQPSVGTLQDTHFQDASGAPTPTVWNLNVTKAAISSYANKTYPRMSITIQNSSATDYDGWCSKEETNITRRPQLVVTYIAADSTPPTYSESGTNITTAGASVSFNIRYNDDTALHPNGQYIFGTNNTGAWANDSAVNWTATPQYGNVSKILNSTVGLMIGYRWYAKDNANNINDTTVYTLTTTAAAANCWTVSDGYCVASPACSPVDINAFLGACFT